MPRQPQPGSRLAVKRGCTCIPNQHPETGWPPTFFVAPGCPIHDTEETDDDE